MKHVLALCAVGLAILGATPLLSAQNLSFTLDRAGAPPSRYAIRVDETSGHGSYRAGQPVGGAAGTGAPEAGVPGAALGHDVPVVVEPAIVKKLFAAVPLVASGRCETHNKKIAQTGTKTLRYEHDGKVSECTYNYSDDDRVNTATSLFEAIGETMQYGDRLAAKLRFDRLGLDTEMDNLQSALTDGRAVAVGNISPVLQAIESDERVMDRVRRKAARVLQGAGVSSGEGSAAADASER